MVLTSKWVVDWGSSVSLQLKINKWVHGHELPTIIYLRQLINSQDLLYYLGYRYLQNNYLVKNHKVLPEP